MKEELKELIIRYMNDGDCEKMKALLSSVVMRVERSIKKTKEEEKGEEKEGGPTEEDVLSVTRRFSVLDDLDWESTSSAVLEKARTDASRSRDCWSTAAT